MKYISEKDQWNRLLKIKIKKQGNNQWRLSCVSDKNGNQVRKGDITFRGTEDQFKKLLRRLKASDIESTPASVKNLTYQQMIDLADNPKGNYIWVKTKNWNMYYNGKKLLLGESIDKDIDIFIQRNKDRMDSDTLAGLIADKFNMDLIDAEEILDTVYNIEEGTMRKIEENYEDFYKRGVEYLGRAIVEKVFDRNSEKIANGLILQEQWTEEEMERAWYLITLAYEKGAYTSTVAGNDYVIRLISGVQDYLNSYWNISPIREAKQSSIDIGYGQLVGIGRDTNGNKVAKLKTNTGKSFSIQTSGNLPTIHKETDLKDVNKNKAEKEVLAYVKKHGTKAQKEILPERVNMRDKNMNIIEISKSVKVDNVILEKGDKIKILE